MWMPFFIYLLCKVAIEHSDNIILNAYQYLSIWDCRARKILLNFGCYVFNCFKVELFVYLLLTNLV